MTQPSKPPQSDADSLSAILRLQPMSEFNPVHDACHCHSAAYHDGFVDTVTSGLALLVVSGNAHNRHGKRERAADLVQHPVPAVTCRNVLVFPEHHAPKYDYGMQMLIEDQMRHQQDAAPIGMPSGLDNSCTGCTAHNTCKHHAGCIRTYCRKCTA